MLALGHFLVDPKRFTTNDFTLSNWKEINKIGDDLIQNKSGESADNSLQKWINLVPSLDVWIDVEESEIHYVRQILPDLDWAGGSLGVRLRYEPVKIESLYEEFLAATNLSKKTKQARADQKKEGPPLELTLWPEDMRNFLNRSLSTYFSLRAYLLDPQKKDMKVGQVLRPQDLPTESATIDGHPLKTLIRVNEIEAQRGFGGAGLRDDEDEMKASKDGRRLSEQLRRYYAKHLEPSDAPEPADLDALEAIEVSQKEFDKKLESGFASALTELETLNYPGVTDPKLKISTRIRPTEGLNHSGAVQFEVTPKDGKEILVPLRLPEEYNGLGYQNLISMVFKLMSFRDAWMRVGKAAKIEEWEEGEKHLISPLHLVLIEEPEAHLHAQVQQVFLRQAYRVLRKHPKLGENPELQTQLIVSTHSSHVAHEAPFSALRYFRRLPPTSGCCVPTSIVINLSQVFGPNDETEKFVTRYLRATHCDLFFADAAILVEGPAEKILVPHFIRKGFQDLNRCYVTLLEINGSHAHRMKPLIEELGLTTLIITDLDSAEGTGHHPAVSPRKGAGQVSRNSTLKTWHPMKEKLDDLLDASAPQKEKKYDQPHFAIRVAFQIPLKVNFKGKEEIAFTTTFEDALVFENLELFKSLSGEGMIAKLKTAVNDSVNTDDLSNKLFEILDEGDKAEFALELLISEQKKQGPGGSEVESDAALEKLKAPKYITEGLAWLQSQFIEEKKTEILAELKGSAAEAKT